MKNILIAIAVVALVCVGFANNADARGWHRNNVRVQKIVTVEKVVVPNARVVQKFVEVPGLAIVTDSYGNAIVQQQIVVERVVNHGHVQNVVVQKVVDNRGNVQKVVQVNRGNVQVNVVRNGRFRIFRR